jgi:hypothetical protein
MSGGEELMKWSWRSYCAIVGFHHDSGVTFWVGKGVGLLSRANEGEHRETGKQNYSRVSKSDPEMFNHPMEDLS